MTTEIISPKSSGLSYYIPKTLDEWTHICNVIASSDLCPAAYKNKPNNVFIAAQMGAEVGLNYMQAVQNIAVINGLPCLYGDAALAVVMTSPHYDGHEEITTDDKAICIMKRKGREDVTRTFTLEDANKAGYLNKTGPWKTHTKRMLQMRARSFAMRDQFPDALKGINVAEEVRDYEPMEKNITPKHYEDGQEVSDKFIEYKNKIDSVEDMEKLMAIADTLKSFQSSEFQINKLRDAYKEKLIFLKNQIQQEETKFKEFVLSREYKEANEENMCKEFE